MNPHTRWFISTLCIAAILGVAAVPAFAGEEIALPSPPQSIVDMAIAITWRYYYGHSQSAGTNDAYGCGRQFTLAVASHADNTTAVIAKTGYSALIHMSTRLRVLSASPQARGTARAHPSANQLGLTPPTSRNSRDAKNATTASRITAYAPSTKAWARPSRSRSVVAM